MPWDNLARPALNVARTWAWTTSLDALPWCSRRMADLYDYWDGRRGVWAMPRRADIDPIDMRDWLARVVLVDVIDGGAQFRYRLIGTELTQLRGRDATGLTVEEAWPAADAEIVLAGYRDVVARREPVFCHATQGPRSARRPQAGIMLLPLSKDGERVDMILGYLAEDIGVLGLVI